MQKWNVSGSLTIFRARIFLHTAYAPLRMVFFA